MKKLTNVKYLLIMSFMLFISLISFKQVFGEEITITPDNFFDNFQLNGQSSYDSNSKIITLTKDEKDQSGSVVLKSLKMDLNYAFSFNADINIGSRTQALGGADGIGIVLHPGNLGDLGGNGGSFGMMSLKNAFGFKVDTFFNSQNEPLYVNAYDPAWLANNKGQLDYPFGAFMYTQDSGLQVYTLGTGNNYEKPQYVSNPNGTFKNIKMTYNPDNKYLQVEYDGKTWIKDVTEWKKNNRYFVLGIAGTTGGQKNLQQVRINKITYTGETKLELKKSNNKSNGAKVGEVVSYTVNATNNGNLDLVTPFITDMLPEGMDKPTNIRVNTSLPLGEGSSNKNAYGEYYDWDASSRKLTVHFSQTDSLKAGGTGNIYYDSRILSGNDGDTKTNTASLAGINDNGIHPTSKSSFKIKGETKLELKKSNNKSNGAKVGEVVSYTVNATNSGNLDLVTPFITDILPEGMDKPTNIRANTSLPLGEGSSNKNAYGEYYDWDASSRKLTVYFSQTDNLKAGGTGNIYYDSRILSGNDGDTKTNTASLAGINDNGIHPTAKSSFKIKGETKLGITKTNNKSSTGAKVGDVVTYKVVGTNDGNLKLDTPSFTDILPTGMDEPTNVKVVGTYESATLKKGKENATSNGEYYTWDSSTRKLTIYTTEIGPGTKKTITYDSKINIGTDGETKKNTVNLTGINDNGIHPTADSTFKIIGEPIINLSKSASVSTAKVGDTIHYSLSLGKNTGNATLLAPVITDVLPVGMEKPSNVVINADGIKVSMKEGKENANSSGEYYDWDANTRTLKVYINSVGINTTKGIEYDTKVLSGTDGEKKVNNASASASNTTNKPTANATVTIKGEPIISLNKSASVSTAKVGDTIHYSLSLGKNTGNATLLAPVITDVLPVGMEKPSNVVINADGIKVSMKEGKENANSSGEYYDWDANTRTLKVYINSVGINTTKGIEYDTKVLSGTDGEKKVNNASANASNTTNKPTANATVTIKTGTITLHIRQEVVNQQTSVVVPTDGFVELTNVKVNDESNIFSISGLTIPSYVADTNQPFKIVKLVRNSEYKGYIPKVRIPELYAYVGYQLTTVEQTHQSVNRVNKPISVIDYSVNSEYWLTIYIEPKISSEGPPFYNWDYKINDFGTIKLN